jgi:polyisoprenoid-binding protein YceI
MSTVEHQQRTTAPSVWSVDQEQTSVQFTVKTFWGLATVRGRFDRFAGSYELTPEGPTIGLSIDADSLDTGNATRDKHLRSDDFFDAAGHPQLRFTSSQARPADGGTLLVEGELEAAGKVVSLTFTAHVLPIGDGLEVTAETEIDQRLLGMSSGPLRMIRRPAMVAVKARLRPEWQAEAAAEAWLGTASS